MDNGVSIVITVICTLLGVGIFMVFYDYLEERRKRRLEKRKSSYLRKQRRNNLRSKSREISRSVKSNIDNASKRVSNRISQSYYDNQVGNIIDIYTNDNDSKKAPVPKYVAKMKAKKPNLKIISPKQKRKASIKNKRKTMADVHQILQDNAGELENIRVVNLYKHRDTLFYDQLIDDYKCLPE